MAKVVIYLVDDYKDIQKIVFDGEELRKDEEGCLTRAYTKMAEICKKPYDKSPREIAKFLDLEWLSPAYFVNYRIYFEGNTHLTRHIFLKNLTSFRDIASLASTLHCFELACKDLEGESRRKYYNRIMACYKRYNKPYVASRAVYDYAGVLFVPDCFNEIDLGRWMVNYFELSHVRRNLFDKMPSDFYYSLGEKVANLYNGNFFQEGFICEVDIRWWENWNKKIEESAGMK